MTWVWLGILFILFAFAMGAIVNKFDDHEEWDEEDWERKFPDEDR
jgi:preprotein translocase subunit SecG